MTRRDALAEWIINHCHKTCGREMNVERETALMEADEIICVISKYKPERKKREAKVEQITYNDKTGKFEGLHTDFLYYIEQQFKAVRHEDEIKKMEAWLYANPKNRKKQYERFIINWMTRAQDKAPRYTNEMVRNNNVGIPSWKTGVGA